jgi:hypothetical protein
VYGFVLGAVWWLAVAAVLVANHGRLPGVSLGNCSVHQRA